ncbi:MAG: N-methyl-L-tryptophan oxidase [Oceanicaulis sp.]|nr:N-methyl-L-tryptophan oxidase [Oceanicaulis sp.]
MRRAAGGVNGRSDIAVIGLGAMGAAALSALARAGADVTGFERYDSPHELGSSHGESRLVRQAYAEGERYLALARRSAALWQTLNAETGAEIYTECGVHYAAPAGARLTRDVVRAAQAAGLPVRTGDGLPGADLIVCPSGHERVFEAEAGLARPEAAIAAWLSRAREAGARAAMRTPVRHISRTPDGFTLALDDGPVLARRVIVTAGGWTGDLAAPLRARLTLQRRVMTWFADPDGLHGPENLPAFVIEAEGGWYYGAPAIGPDGVKIGRHHGDEPCAHPDQLDRRPGPSDADGIADLARSAFPGLGPMTRQSACFYTMSPDEDFILSFGELDPDMAVVAGLSGHGFKFAPAIGEALAAWALDETPSVDLSVFALARFG